MPKAFGCNEGLGVTARKQEKTMNELLYWNFRRPLEKMRLAFVWRLPRWLVYWCAIRLIAHATQGAHSNQIVPDLSAMDALKRWET